MEQHAQPSAFWYLANRVWSKTLNYRFVWLPDAYSKWNQGLVRLYTEFRVSPGGYFLDQSTYMNLFITVGFIIKVECVENTLFYLSIWCPLVNLGS